MRERKKKRRNYVIYRDSVISWSHVAIRVFVCFFYFNSMKKSNLLSRFMVFLFFYRSNGVKRKPDNHGIILNLWDSDWIIASSKQAQIFGKNTLISLLFLKILSSDSKDKFFLVEAIFWYHKIGRLFFLFLFSISSLDFGAWPRLKDRSYYGVERLYFCTQWARWWNM